MKRTFNPGPETSSTMLRDLRDTGDSGRWTDFERAYRPFMAMMLSGMRKTHPGLRPDMYDDVIQETLIVLMKKFPAFDYDRDAGSFRGFLRGILANKVKTVIGKRWGEGRVLYDSAMADAAAEQPTGGGDDLVAERFAMAQELWKILLRRVFDGSKYTRQSQEIFTKIISGHYTTDELTRQYGLNQNAIYQLKNRVMRDLRARKEVVERGSGDLFDLLEKLMREELENGTQK